MEQLAVWVHGQEEAQYEFIDMLNSIIILKFATTILKIND